MDHLSDIIGDTPMFAASVDGGKYAYKNRSEWMEGWNAACMWFGKMNVLVHQGLTAEEASDKLYEDSMYHPPEWRDIK